MRPAQPGRPSPGTGPACHTGSANIFQPLVPAHRKQRHHLRPWSPPRSDHPALQQLRGGGRSPAHLTCASPGRDSCRLEGVLGSEARKVPGQNPGTIGRQTCPRPLSPAPLPLGFSLNPGIRVGAPQEGSPCEVCPHPAQLHPEGPSRAKQPEGLQPLKGSQPFLSHRTPSNQPFTDPRTGDRCLKGAACRGEGRGIQNPLPPPPPTPRNPGTPQSRENQRRDGAFSKSHSRWVADLDRRLWPGPGEAK